MRIAAYRLTFPASGTAIDSHSLADGRYSLTVIADGISNGNFDGNGDGLTEGSPTDNYLLSAPTGTAPFPINDGIVRLLRLYGDATGDGTTGLDDFALFWACFNSNDDDECNVFDFENDDLIVLSDFAMFRTRFNSSI